MLSGRFLSQFAPSCNYKLYLPNFAHYVLIYLFSPNIALVLSQWSDIIFEGAFDFPYTLDSGRYIDLCLLFLSFYQMATFLLKGTYISYTFLKNFNKISLQIILELRIFKGWNLL